MVAKNLIFFAKRRTSHVAYDGHVNIRILNIFLVTIAFHVMFVTVIDEVNNSGDKSFKAYVKQIGNKTKSAFTSKNLSKRLPITQWLPKYTSEDFVGDLLAGFTVGLMLIPQSISYAALARLPPQVNITDSCIS